MMASVPHTVSPMLMNGIIFTFDGIAMISQLLTHLNPSSSENPLLAISYLTRPEIGLGEASIDYMYRVWGISKLLRRVLTEEIIPLFTIASLYHDRYP